MDIVELFDRLCHHHANIFLLLHVSYNGQDLKVSNRMICLEFTEEKKKFRKYVAP